MIWWMDYADDILSYSWMRTWSQKWTSKGLSCPHICRSLSPSLNSYRLQCLVWLKWFVYIKYFRLFFVFLAGFLHVFSAWFIHVFLAGFLRFFEHWVYCICLFVLPVFIDLHKIYNEKTVEMWGYILAVCLKAEQLGWLHNSFWKRKWSHQRTSKGLSCSFYPPPESYIRFFCN